MNLKVSRNLLKNKNLASGFKIVENPTFYILPMMKLVNSRSVLGHLMMMALALLELMSWRNHLLDWVLRKPVKRYKT